MTPRPAHGPATRAPVPDLEAAVDELDVDDAVTALWALEPVGADVFAATT